MDRIRSNMLDFRVTRYFYLPLLWNHLFCCIKSHTLATLVLSFKFFPSIRQLLPTPFFSQLFEHLVPVLVFPLPKELFNPFLFLLPLLLFLFFLISLLSFANLKHQVLTYTLICDVFRIIFKQATKINGIICYWFAIAWLEILFSGFAQLETLVKTRSNSTLHSQTYTTFSLYNLNFYLGHFLLWTLDFGHFIS